MTQPNDPNFIIVGKIGSTYGIRGWLKIVTYTEFGANILDYKPWYLSSEHNEPVEVVIEAGRMHSDTVIVKFSDIDTPEAAAKLTGKTISIKRSQLPTLEKGEFYWDELIGLTVINKDGESLGKVVYLMAAGPHDVLVVKKDKEHAIPYLPGKVILKVDLEKKEILVDWELI